MFAGIFFIVMGLMAIFLRRQLGEGQVAFREKTKFLTGTTTQQRQETLLLVMGTVVVGIGVLFLFVALFRAL